ncbi:hypothetical protein DPMN_101558 [Dreissena polymorpha]|uniref:Uncharacterized protein n=1 Tax=Dreissena polymorpha TaxID=45954 RepID=A0A9D4R8F0_DREPO|nr:hypothetical protein DPMN_101558 [Dreissena polymorpha]
MFIENYEGRSRSLYEVVKQFRWGDDQEAAFLDLKKALVEAPVLGLLNRTTRLCWTRMRLTRLLVEC